MRPDGKRGFTLLEALVATAVVALLLVPVLQGFVANANTARVADRQLAVRLLMERLLATLPMASGAAIPRSAGSDGDFGWRIDPEAMSVPVGDASREHFTPYRVRLTVSGEGTTTSIETVRLGPLVP